MKKQEYEVKTFLVPIAIDGEHAKIEVRSRRPEDLPSDIFDKSYMVAVKYYTALVSLVEHEGKEVELVSARMDVSPHYYYGAKVVLLSELTKSMSRGHENTINSYKDLGVDKFIIDRFGRFSPYYEHQHKDCFFLEMPKHCLKNNQ